MPTLKIGASNRATAGLFAMQHGLLPDDRSLPGRRAGLHRYLRPRIEDDESRNTVEVSAVTAIEEMMALVMSQPIVFT